MSLLLAYYHNNNQKMTKLVMGMRRSTSRRVCRAGLMIRAFKGMFGIILRVQFVSGLEARSMGVRKDINGILYGCISPNLG